MAGARAAMKLVTLDANRTCIRVTHSPGFHYAQVAREFGVKVEVKAVDEAFMVAFKQMNSKIPNFGCGRMHCKLWWNELISMTLHAAGVSRTENFPEIGDRLYAHFDGPDNWEVYPDVLPTLEHLKSSGIKLGVISNFDERLRNILSSLDLSKYFDFIYASYEVKCAKPDPRIFELALEEASVKASEAIHVGDSKKLDYMAARAIGMRSLLLQRDGNDQEKEKNIDIVQELGEMLSYL